MVSLKMTDAEAKAEGYGSPTEAKPPEYPWGTCITLADEVVKALFPDGLPKVGLELDMTGKVRVKGAREDQREGDKTRLSVELQLTDIEIPNGKTVTPMASRLYGEAGPLQSQD